jgi:uncharacterized damage-inducible protein DinB
MEALRRSFRDQHRVGREKNIFVKRGTSIIGEKVTIGFGVDTAREAEDQRIIAYVDRLDGTRLSAEIRYRRVSGPEEHAQPLAEALAHWFNHQTHHRGQAHAILTGLAGHAPELDLLLFQRLASAARP